MISGRTPRDTHIQYARCGQLRTVLLPRAPLTPSAHSSQMTYRRRPAGRRAGVERSHQAAGMTQSWCAQRERRTRLRPAWGASQT